MSINGKTRTELITRSVVGLFIKRGFSCHIEVGVLPWGKRRVDILCLNTKRHLVAIEVKQSIQDFRNDRKWTQYLPYCAQFYFAFPHDLWSNYEDEIRELPKEAGIIILESNGLARVIRKCNIRDMDSSIKRDLITKLAWRGGLSKRNTRRIRIIL